MDSTAAYASLMKDVNSFEFTSYHPCKLLLIGDEAFPVLVSTNVQVLIAASCYGKGLMMVVSHEGILKDFKFSRFLRNAVEWLKPFLEALVGVHPPLDSLSQLLLRAGTEVQAGAELGPSLRVCCMDACDSRQAKDLVGFVKGGGGLLTGGQALHWASQHGKEMVLFEFPGNQVTSVAGMYFTGTSTMKIFILNAIGWLDAGKGGQVGIAGDLKDFFALLSQEKIPCKLTDLEENLSVYCCKAYSDEEVEKIHEFVSRGGSLLIGGQARSWAAGNADENAIAEFPGNKILQKFGVGILGDNMLVPSQPVLHPDEVFSQYHFHKALSQCQQNFGKKEALKPPYSSWLKKLAHDSTVFLRIPAQTSLAIYSVQEEMAECLSVTIVPHEVQIGCHTDDLSYAAELKWPPLVVKKFKVEKNTMEVSSLRGGLIYIIVPKESTLGQILVAIKEAVQAPFFKLGETDISAQSTIRQYPAPWAELAKENIILTVPAVDVLHMGNPENLLSIWNKMMNAIAELAAIPATFPRPERMVGCLSVPEMVDVQSLQAKGLWGAIHELGHNQQQSEWEFPPNSTEATCNLWSVYENETVLGIPRDKAHNELAPEFRKKRIQDYVENGAQLKDWEVFTALETYLQLQEAFGWEAFMEILSEYHNMSELPDDNNSKMNLWAETFSRLVKKNLAPGDGQSRRAFLSSWLFLSPVGQMI
ncbi:LOW QUALITY PROTEIN: TRPM8 channel-associated factor homolog [Pterocles gutturalis]